jgi:HAD superfamily hydrolase (TIGR01509 family)
METHRRSQQASTVTSGTALPIGDALRLVILDCDGVLFDSRDANVAFYDSILTALGEPQLDEHGRELCHRLSGPQLWDHLFAHDAALHARAKQIAARADYSPFYPLMRPVADLESTLLRLSSHCPLALATNRGRTVAGVVERFGLDRFLSIAFGILDVPRAKPAPDLLLACLERARVDAAAAVFVGDTPVDRAAAAAAGVSYVGIGTESGAAHTLTELRELPALLRIPSDRARVASEP